MFFAIAALSITYWMISGRRSRFVGPVVEIVAVDSSIGPDEMDSERVHTTNVIPSKLASK